MGERSGGPWGRGEGAGDGPGDTAGASIGAAGGVLRDRSSSNNNGNGNNTMPSESTLAGRNWLNRLRRGSPASAADSDGHSDGHRSDREDDGALMGGGVYGHEFGGWSPPGKPAGGARTFAMGDELPVVHRPGGAGVRRSRSNSDSVSKGGSFRSRSSKSQASADVRPGGGGARRRSNGLVSKLLSRKVFRRRKRGHEASESDSDEGAHLSGEEQSDNEDDLAKTANGGLESEYVTHSVALLSPAVAIITVLSDFLTWRHPRLMLVLLACVWFNHFLFAHFAVVTVLACEAIAALIAYNMFVGLTDWDLSRVDVSNELDAHVKVLADWTDLVNDLDEVIHLTNGTAAFKLVAFLAIGAWLGTTLPTAAVVTLVMLLPGARQQLQNAK